MINDANLGNSGQRDNGIIVLLMKAVNKATPYRLV